MSTADLYRNPNTTFVEEPTNKFCYSLSLMGTNVRDCKECMRLWDEYRAAMLAHIKLDGQLKLAVLERKLEVIEQTTIEVENAEGKRKLIRAAIQKHEDEDHGKSHGKSDAATAD